MRKGEGRGTHPGYGGAVHGSAEEGGPKGGGWCGEADGLSRIDGRFGERDLTIRESGTGARERAIHTCQGECTTTGGRSLGSSLPMAYPWSLN